MRETAVGLLRATYPCDIQRDGRIECIHIHVATLVEYHTERKCEYTYKQRDK